jgi:hypothetical protein
MVRVDPDLVLAGTEPGDAVVEVVETDSEVAGIPPRRLEPETGLANDARSHQRQEVESDERRLLREFVERDIADSQDGDADGPIDREVALGISAENHRVKFSAAHDNRGVIREDVTFANETLLHLFIMPNELPLRFRRLSETLSSEPLAIGERVRRPIPSLA